MTKPEDDFFLAVEEGNPSVITGASGTAARMPTSPELGARVVISMGPSARETVHVVAARGRD